ncbi:MAG TPA: SRPBCC family protein [Novosphingobium sp.]|nr:SRPBCC family protein [Novosphingobium sp.]
MRRFGFQAAAIGLAGLLAQPLHAEVTDQFDNGFAIALSAETTAGKSDAWKMLTAPAQWWSSEHTWSGDAANLYIDSQATGCFCEKLPRPADAPEGQRMGSVEHGHIVYADPQRGVLRLIGGLGPLQSEPVTGVLTVVLKPHEGGTRIEWTYVVDGHMRMKAEDMAPLVDKVLGEQIERLADKLGKPEEPAGEPAEAADKEPPEKPSE